MQIHRPVLFTPTLIRNEYFQDFDIYVSFPLLKNVCLFFNLKRLRETDTYVNLNCILGDVTTQVALQPALKFNGGGHINHTIFWTNLSPNGGGEPQGKGRNMFTKL